MNSEDIQNIFFAECEEALEAAEQGLDACKAQTQDDETINAIFRAVHSIKGGAGAFGHTAMQTYTHCFETLLADIRDGTVELRDELVDLLLAALDCLRDHVDAAQSQSSPPDDKSLIDRLTAAQAANASGQSDSSEPSQDEAAKPAAPADPAESADDASADLDDLLAELAGPVPVPDQNPVEDDKESDEGTGGWKVHIRPHSGAMTNGSEPLLWLRELVRLGGVCQLCDTDSLPPLAEIDCGQGYLGWTFLMPSNVAQDQVEEIFDFVGDDCSVAYGDGAEMPHPRLPEADETHSASEANSESAPAPVVPINAAQNAGAAPSKSAAKEKGKPAAPTAKSVPSASSAKRAASNQSVRLDLAKLDRMIDCVGELVIAQAMLAERLADESLAHIEELAMLDNLVRDIQEHAMAFRAQPISSVFSRVPRLLRDLAGTTGKHVNLNIQGETTELDKTVIERLSDPLTHLIRNAVDHGVEDVETRLAAGKPAEGTLSLSAEQKAGRILIKIGDDGKGLDRDKLRQKALDNGIISADAQLTDEEICNLVFSPGLSTAKEVSSVSGRGVGMDVVRQNVKDLGGRITIESAPGKGTTFILALPLTLAISDGMIVQVGEQSFVIPLAHVVESLRPEQGDIKEMGTSRRMLNVRGQFVPILGLDGIAGPTKSTDDPASGVLVVVETESAGQAALLVDEITDQRQFVIKSLDTHFRSVDTIAGATILGNGRVALIIDVDSLVQSVADQSGARAAA